MTRREQQLAVRRRLVAKLRLHRRAVTWLGLAFAAVGVAIIAVPGAGSLLTGVAAGWLLWFAGSCLFALAVLTATDRSFFGALLTSLAAVAGGAFLFFNPTAGALAVALMIAAVLILDGAFELALALDLRPLAAWRWVLASSIASALAGVVVAAGGGESRRLLAALLGLAFASTGIALLALGRTRRATRGGRRQAGGPGRSPSTSST